VGHLRGEPATETTLRELCHVFGICLSPAALAEMRELPVDDLDAWTRAVFVKEGLDTPHDRLWSQVRAHVESRLGQAR
jgi:hypothetical protein